MHLVPAKMPTAAAYVECRVDGGEEFFGVGISSDVARASVEALLSAVNRV